MIILLYWFYLLFAEKAFLLIRFTNYIHNMITWAVKCGSYHFWCQFTFADDDLFRPFYEKMKFSSQLSCCELHFWYGIHTFRTSCRLLLLLSYTYLNHLSMLSFALFQSFRLYESFCFHFLCSFLRLISLSWQ